MSTFNFFFPAESFSHVTSDSQFAITRFGQDSFNQILVGDRELTIPVANDGTLFDVAYISQPSGSYLGSSTLNSDVNSITVLSQSRRRQM